MADVIKSIGAGRDYSTISAWESLLDDTGIYASGDHAIGELYDQTYSEQATVDGGGTVGLSQVTLRAHSSVRHTGKPRTGPRIVNSFNPFWGTANSVTYNFEWFEYDFNGGDDSEIIALQSGATTRCRNLIVHNAVHTSTTFNCYGMRCRGSSDNHEIDNCLVFNVEQSGGFRVSGILLENTTTGKVRNCTVTDIRETNVTSGNAEGINFLDSANHTVQNNLVTNITSVAGTAECYDNATVTSAVTDSNISDDTTSPDGATYRSQTVTFRNPDNNDYRLSASDASGLPNGTDLGTGTVAVDLLGRDRDAQNDTWDAGAFQYVAASVNTFRVVKGLTNSTATGTADFTVPDFGTPAGAIVYINSATDSSNPNQTSTIHFLSTGYWDGTNQISKAESSHDAQTTLTISNKYMMSDKIGHYVNNSGTPQAEWSISNITNGVRITTDVSDSSQHQIMVILIPSTGISNIAAFIQDWSGASPGPGGAAAVTVSSLSFEADLVLSQCGVNPGADSIDDSIQSGWGWTHNVDGTDANIVQMSVGFSVNDNRDISAGTTWTSVYTTDIYGLSNITNSTSVVRYGVRFTGFGASGWTMTKYTDETTDPPTTKVSATFALEEDTMHLAIKFVGSPNIKVFQPNAPNAVGAQATTTPGFQPLFGMLFAPMNRALGGLSTLQRDDSQSIAAFDSDEQATIGYLDEDNVSTTFLSTYADRGIQVYEAAGTSRYDATFRGFDATGWTWNFTTVNDATNADPWVALALGELITTVNIQLTLVDVLGNALANLTGIKWAWFDSANPNTFAAPTDKGNAETTDGSGLLEIALTNTTLTTGQTGTLVLFLGSGTDYASFRITL